MNWLWLNVPLATLIFGAVTGIPMWMVIKHPDTGPDAAAAGPVARPVPAAAASGVAAHRGHGSVRTSTAA